MIKKIIKSIVAILLYFGFYPLLLVLLQIFLTKYNFTVSKTFLLLFSDFLMLGILYLIYKKDLKEYFKNFKENFKKNFKPFFTIWIKTLLLSSVISLIISIFIKTDLPTNEQNVRELLIQIPLYMIISTPFISPFIEEIIFRKTVYDILKKYKYIFIIFSGLFFGLAHINFSFNFLDLVDLIPYTILGSGLAYMYVESDSLFFPLFFHSLHNAVLVIFFYLTILLGVN